MNRKSRKYYLVILSWLIFIILAACQPTTSSSGVPSKPPPTNTTTVSPFPKVVSLTPIPSPLIPELLPPSPTPLSFASLTPIPSLSPTQAAAAAYKLCSPLAWETIPEIKDIISDPYNPPPMGRDERHQGVDFSHYSRKGLKTIEGEPVQVVLAGRVVSVIKNRLPYGNMVIIETSYADLPAGLQDALEMAAGESLYILYAHFGHEPLVMLGDSVACGQVIGDVGMTGYNIVNPHLHLEAWSRTTWNCFRKHGFLYCLCNRAGDGKLPSLAHGRGIPTFRSDGFVLVQIR